MGSRDFDSNFRFISTMVKGIFVVTIVLMVVYYVSLGVVAFKAIDALDKECKGSIAYCLGKAKKSFDEGANE